MPIEKTLSNIPIEIFIPRIPNHEHVRAFSRICKFRAGKSVTVTSVAGYIAYSSLEERKRYSYSSSCKDYINNNNNNNNMSKEEKKVEKQLSFKEVLNKAAGSAIRGGVAGAAAMGANVRLF